MKPGPKPSSGTAMTHAERQARYRAKQAAGAPTFRCRKPLDRRSQLQRWRDVVAELQDLQDEYQAWLDALPQNMADSATAEVLRLPRSATSTRQNWRASFRPGGLAATELLHDVKADQIVAGLANDEATLVIINSRMG